MIILVNMLLILKNKNKEGDRGQQDRGRQVRKLKSTINMFVFDKINEGTLRHVRAWAFLCAAQAQVIVDFESFRNFCVLTLKLIKAVKQNKLKACDYAINSFLY